jgi:hypothetical protein
MQTPVSFFFVGLPGNMPDETKSSRSIHVHSPSSDDPLIRTETLELVRMYWKLASDKQRESVMNLLKSLTEGE